MATKSINAPSAPFNATHPGELLADELKERNMTQKELASLIQMPASVLNDIVKGKRSISAELAVLLEVVLEIKATYWMSLQSQYDIDLANISQKILMRKGEIAMWEAIANFAPIKALHKRGILNDNISHNIQRIWEIFSVKSLEELSLAFAKEPVIALYKKSEKLQTDSVNLFGWKNYAIWNSTSIKLANRFDPSNEQQIIKELNDVFLENSNTLQRIEQVLNHYGIKFLVVDKFDKTPVDGLSFWRGENPTIVLTLRLKNIDNLAFSTMHELAHIVKHLAQDQALELINIDGYKNSVEEEANAFAQNALIPNAAWSSFMSSAKAINPHAIQYRIKSFAQEHRVNEAIVLGMYKHAINFYSMKTTIDSAIH